MKHNGKCMESCVFECEDFPKENQKHANKATDIVLGKTSNFLYILLAHVYYFLTFFVLCQKYAVTNFYFSSKSCVCDI